LLQLEDDSFAGTAYTDQGDALVVFDAGGQIKWTLPGSYPRMATAGGGLITTAGFQYSADGAATGIMAVSEFQSWTGHVYQLGPAQLQRIETFPVLLGATFWPQQGGNPSQIGAQSIRLRFSVTDDPVKTAVIATRLLQLKGKLAADAVSPNGTCAAWLTNPVRPAENWSLYLSEMIAMNRYVHGIYEIENPKGKRTVDDTIAASINGKNPDGTYILPAEPFVGINDNGAFYRSTNLRGNPWALDPDGRNQGHYGGGNPRAQADTLLHELAHLIVGQDRILAPNESVPRKELISIAFVHDFPSREGQDHNRRVLTNKCGNLILTFPKQ
jgi:hypothetical protein